MLSKNAVEKDSFSILGQMTLLNNYPVEKVTFSDSNLRCETARGPIATCSKRKSAWPCIFVQKEGLGFEGHIPRFGGRLLVVLCKPGDPTTSATEK